MIDATARIHPLALVEGSIVGPRTRVWQFASVIRGARLGADCSVASCATLDGPQFGDRCVVSQGVAMGPGFEIGDDVFIGPNVTVCNDRWPRATKGGFDAEALRAGFVTVRIGNWASIGANAVILPGVTLGKRAMIAAGAVVDRDVPYDHIFKRDGSIAPIKNETRAFGRRMRAAA